MVNYYLKLKIFLQNAGVVHWDFFSKKNRGKVRGTMAKVASSNQPMLLKS